MKTLTSLVTTSLLAITLLFSSRVVANPQRTSEETLKQTAPVTLTLHESNDGATVTLPKNALVKVMLPSNAGSTGYCWTASLSNPEILESLIISHVPPYNPMTSKSFIPGKIEPAIWNFKTMTPGQTTITFSLQRSWEKNVAPAKEVQFTIIVE